MVIIATAIVMSLGFTLVFFALLYAKRVIQNKLHIQEIKNKHQKTLLKETLKSQEAEKNRLGSELHDSVGVMLSSIKMNLSVIQSTKKTDDIKDAISHLDNIIGQVRQISHQMMPIELKKYGIKKAIESLFKQISNEELTAKIIDWAEIKFDNDEQTALYRIVQELTNNTIKYAQAKNISFFLIKNEDNIYMKYEDDGIGYPEEIVANSGGMGIWNVLNRSQVLESKVRFVNTKNGGARTEFLIEKHKPLYIKNS